MFVRGCCSLLVARFVSCVDCCCLFVVCLLYVVLRSLRSVVARGWFLSCVDVCW